MDMRGNKILLSVKDGQVCLSELFENYMKRHGNQGQRHKQVEAILVISIII